MHARHVCQPTDKPPCGMLRQHLAAFGMLCLACACSVDPYEAGDGRYSYLKAEMAELHTVAKNKADYAITDQGERLTLTPPLTCNWANTPDSIYRAMLYYTQTPQHTQGVMAVNVWVMHPAETQNQVPTDPVKLESCWLSHNKRYLNLRMGIMTGKPEDADSKQKIGVIRRKTDTSATGQKTISLQLLHAQNNVPAYYTTTVYISIPITQYQSGDTIRMSVNTYQGIVEKAFAL